MYTRFTLNHKKSQEYEVSTPEVFGGKTVQVYAQLFTSLHHLHVSASEKVRHFRQNALETREIYTFPLAQDLFRHM